MTYSGGQRSARKASRPAFNIGDLLNQIGRSAQAVVNPEAAYAEDWYRQGLTPASSTTPQGPTRDIYEQPGVGYFDRTSGRFLGQAPSAPQLPNVIVQGTRDGVTPDRTQSDEYKAQLAQYGALQKAKKFEEADKLGMEIWQQKYGKTPMAQPGGAVGAFNPLMQAMFKYQKGASVTDPSYAASATQVQPLGGEDFAVAANAVPAPWNQQGAMVDANRGVANLQPEQAKFTTGEGMPAFPTTGEKAAQLLSDPQFARLLRK